jgi:hypothetical protein
VIDENGNPISAATIDVANLSTTTDSAGNFELVTRQFVIAGEPLKQALELKAVAAGYAP